ncbi:MAG TPA: hypothetical protein DCW35_07395 [Polynucleobacter sp.]|nr:hypothetical protein [Polynucleobacter sp.]
MVLGDGGPPPKSQIWTCRRTTDYPRSILPLHEPIVQYGPFVMNTRAEIEQAIHDYQNNRFVIT